MHKYLKFGLFLTACAVASWLYAGTLQAQSTERVVAVFGSEPRTATTTSVDFINTTGNANVSGAYLVLDVSGIAASPLITLSVQAKDPVSGKYEPIFNASTGVSAAGTVTYLIYPGVGTASDDVAQVVSRPLPPVWRVSVAHLDTDAITYTVGALLVD